MTPKSNIMLDDDSLESVNMSPDSGGRGGKVPKNADTAEGNKDGNSEDEKELGDEENTDEEEEEEMEEDENPRKNRVSA